MSLGYAEKLSWREDLGGQLGDKELFDTDAEFERKMTELEALVRTSRKCVVFTGAGISTACGIPDFRGPTGIWTLQKKGKPLPKLKTSFEHARPSLTHQALVGLMEAGKVHYICSQNVDGLHLRSGVKRENLAELHGNCFSERCEKCDKEYVRDFEMATVGFKCTGRRCTMGGCGGRLRDHILDWEDALPEDELVAAEEHASSADLSICLGTSLQITPANGIPVRTVKAGGKMVIVNLQRTPKDKHAAILLRGLADRVMGELMRRLAMPIPSYVRVDRFVLRTGGGGGGTGRAGAQGKGAAAAAKKEPPSSVEAEDVKEEVGGGEDEVAEVGGRKGGGGKKEKEKKKKFSLELQVESVHGASCRLPAVASVEVDFPDHPQIRARTLKAPPYQVHRAVPGPGCYMARVRLHFADACDVREEMVEVMCDVQADGTPKSFVHEVETMRAAYPVSGAEPTAEEGEEAREAKRPRT